MYSESSKRKLYSVHPDLRKVFEKASESWPHSIIYGARTKEEQAKLVELGFSKTMNSKHLIQPSGYSHAVDAMPDTVDWKDREKALYFAGFILGIANMMSVKVRHGGDWNKNRQVSDESFFDVAHFELED